MEKESTSSRFWSGLLRGIKNGVLIATVYSAVFAGLGIIGATIGLPASIAGAIGFVEGASIFAAVKAALVAALPAITIAPVASALFGGVSAAFTSSKPQADLSPRARGRDDVMRDATIAQATEVAVPALIGVGQQQAQHVQAAHQHAQAATPTGSAWRERVGGTNQDRIGQILTSREMSAKSRAEALLQERAAQSAQETAR